MLGYLLSLLATALALLVPYLHSKLRFRRFKEHTSIPRLPSGLLLGHLKHINDFIRRGSPDVPLDYIFAQLRESIG